MTTSGSAQDPINDSEVYRIEVLAARLGMTLRGCRQFVRANCHHIEIQRGCILVSGYAFRQAIERFSFGNDDFEPPQEPQK